MSDIKQKARELLAAEYRLANMPILASHLDDGISMPAMSNAALRAIEAALRTSTHDARSEITQSMRNFADVADRCGITEGNAPAAIRAWADMLDRTPDAGEQDAALWAACLRFGFPRKWADGRWFVPGKNGEFYETPAAAVEAAIAQREGA